MIFHDVQDFLARQSSTRMAHRSWSRQRPQIFRYLREKPSFTNPARLTKAIEAALPGWMLASRRCSFKSTKA